MVEEIRGVKNKPCCGKNNFEAALSFIGKSVAAQAVLILQYRKDTKLLVFLPKNFNGRSKTHSGLRFKMSLKVSAHS